MFRITLWLTTLNFFLVRVVCKRNSIIFATRKVGNIKLTKHDRYVFALYEQVMKQYPDYDKVIQLYDYLDQYRIKGWIMTLAKNMLYI